MIEGFHHHLHEHQRRGEENREVEDELREPDLRECRLCHDHVGSREHYSGDAVDVLGKVNFQATREEVLRVVFGREASKVIAVHVRTAAPRGT